MGDGQGDRSGSIVRKLLEMFTSDNVKYSMSAYLVIDIPQTGYTVAEQKLNVDGLIGYLSASSGARVTQLLGGEN